MPETLSTCNKAKLAAYDLCIWRDLLVFFSITFRKRRHEIAKWLCLINVVMIAAYDEDDGLKEVEAD